MQIFVILCDLWYYLGVSYSGCWRHLSGKLKHHGAITFLKHIKSVIVNIVGLIFGFVSNSVDLVSIHGCDQISSLKCRIIEKCYCRFRIRSCKMPFKIRKCPIEMGSIFLKYSGFNFESVLNHNVQTRFMMNRSSELWWEFQFFNSRFLLDKIFYKNDST